MSNKKIGIGIGIVVVLALGVGIYLNTRPSGNKAGEVRIAANLPLSGDLATYGVSVRDGMTLALEALAKEDPAGPKLVFDWQDNASEPKTAVTIMQKQYLQPP